MCIYNQICGDELNWWKPSTGLDMRPPGARVVPPQGPILGPHLPRGPCVPDVRNSKCWSLAHNGQFNSYETLDWNYPMVNMHILVVGFCKNNWQMPSLENTYVSQKYQPTLTKWFLKNTVYYVFGCKYWSDMI